MVFKKCIKHINALSEIEQIRTVDGFPIDLQSIALTARPLSPIVFISHFNLNFPQTSRFSQENKKTRSKRVKSRNFVRYFTKIMYINVAYQLCVLQLIHYWLIIPSPLVLRYNLTLFRVYNR